jgi:hypothetical protein
VVTIRLRPRTAVLVTILALSVTAASTATAQSARDSAGIRIVSSDAPRWSGRTALRLGAAPSLLIPAPPRTDQGPRKFEDLIELADGTVVVAEASGDSARIYDRTGRFLRTLAPAGQGYPELRRIQNLFRTPGDTIGARISGAIVLFTPEGAEVGRIAGPPPQMRSPRPLPIALFPGRRRMMITPSFPSPAAPGTRILLAYPISLVDSLNHPVQELGALPITTVAMEDQPRQIWFAPTAAYTADSASFYYGYPAEYSISRYDGEGRLTHIIRRRWEPIAVTAADREDYVREWGKNWIRSTGAEAEREYAELRGDPYWETVPAFAQLIIDAVGRLWVRRAHLPDAASNGEFYTVPLVPSVWSVFDREGRWLCDVTMPARFHPKVIGRDHVTGLGRDSTGAHTVVRYPLQGGGR